MKISKRLLIVEHHVPVLIIWLHQDLHTKLSILWFCSSQKQVIRA